MKHEALGGKGQILSFFSFLYQVQDGGQDLVNSLNLVCGETDDFHGVGDGLEFSPIVDAGLQRRERWRSLMRIQWYTTSSRQSVLDIHDPTVDSIMCEVNE